MTAPATVDCHRDFVRVTLGAGTLDVHWVWLRHNCPCCVHPQTGERILDVRHIPRDLAATAVTVEDDQLTVRWLEGGREHQSAYAWSWLLAHRYGTAAEAGPPTSSSPPVPSPSCPPSPLRPSLA
jgi:hypothetical protein